MLEDSSLIEYCLLNELDLKRINLPKNVEQTELHRNEAQFSILNGQLILNRKSDSVDDIRLGFFQSFTQQVLDHFKLKDLEFKFIVNLNDGPENEAAETRFCFARPRDSAHICIPDSHLPRLNSICEVLPQWDIPFDEKVNKASFFGSDTGRKYPDGSVQRVKFCQKYKNHQRIDAKIVNFVEQPIDPEILGEVVSIKDQLLYRYILNINGNTTSWERLIWAMSSNSFCIFIRPPKHQDEISWYYHIFDVSSSFLMLGENEVENFIYWADNNKEELINLNERQKIMGNTLAKMNLHAQYYGNLLANYNSIYNESLKQS